MTRVEVFIEELVLHGFAPGDRHRLGAVVERELARLFGEQGVPPWLARGGELAQLPGGSFTVTPDIRAETVGAQVAQAVYQGLHR